MGLPDWFKLPMAFLLPSSYAARCLEPCIGSAIDLARALCRAGTDEIIKLFINSLGGYMLQIQARRSNEKVRLPDEP